MVGVLRVLDNWTIPQWTVSKTLLGQTLSFSISANAILSLFATVTKTALTIPVAACLSQLKWN